IMGYVPKS
ncbi:hypothetical protein CFOL_v3_28495, partial [Cephalotus follicularis]